MLAIHNVGETRYNCNGINAAELNTRFTILCSSCRENHNCGNFLCYFAEDDIQFF